LGALDNLHWEHFSDCTQCTRQLAPNGDCAVHPMHCPLMLPCSFASALGALDRSLGGVFVARPPRARVRMGEVPVPSVLSCFAQIDVPVESLRKVILESDFPQSIYSDSRDLCMILCGMWS
jgi:hypothetical protein